MAPTCKRCGRPHFNFVACQQADEFDEQQQARNQLRQRLAQPVFRPRENDWHNRYSRKGYVQIADGVAVLRRPPLHSVTRPDFDHGDAA